MATVFPAAETSAKLLDVQAVAEMLGCSPRHVYRLSDAGRMPAPLKLGPWSDGRNRQSKNGLPMAAPLVERGCGNDAMQLLDSM